MKLQRMLLFAGLGWLAGALLTLLMGFVVAPAVIGGERSLANPVDQVILAMTLLVMTPGALAGGVIGGRMMHEGGGAGQLWMACLIGLLIALPFGCLGFWYLGW